MCVSVHTVAVYAVVVMFQCCNVEELQTCNIANLKVANAMFQSSKVQRLQRIKVARLQGCKTVRLHGSKIVRLKSSSPVIPSGHLKGVAPPWQRSSRTLMTFVLLQYLKIYIEQKLILELLRVRCD